MFLCAATTSAGPFQLVSFADLGRAPAGAGGDSIAPIISPDGRFVLFSSAAGNLVVNSNGNPVVLHPAIFNVYLRDRSSNTTVLVSANLSGLTGGNGDSFPVQISTNGRFVLFESSATDLVENDTNGVADVFLRDLVNSTTTLLSANSDGQISSAISRSSCMTPDAHYVAFVSAATNLVAGDTNGIPDVFVRDVVSATTILVSQGAIPFNSSSSSENPVLSVDGRYVAFSSTAKNLLPGLTNHGDVYLRDLQAGTTIWASTGARASLRATNIICFNPALSEDGNFLSYISCASTNVGGATQAMVFRYSVAGSTTDLVATNAAVPYANYEEIRSLAMTPDGRFIAFVARTNGTSTTVIRLWDASNPATTMLVSADVANGIPVGFCDWPAVDHTGRFVVFLSSATNLVTNSISGDCHLYVRDTETTQTFLVALDSNRIGPPLPPNARPALSADGRFVAFEGLDPGLVAAYPNHDYNVLLRDISTNRIELVSIRAPALPCLSVNGASTLGLTSISADGRFVAFASESDNVVPDDTNSCRDVFLHDRLLGSNILVSVGTNGSPGDFASTDASVSQEGRYVAFTSTADNLVPGDINKARDVFVRDIQTSTTVLVSINTNLSGSGNAPSSSPTLGSDARFVLFRSQATDLAVGPFTTGTENLFLRDLQNTQTYALTTSGVSFSAMSIDGRVVAYGSTSGTTTTLNIWDSLAAHNVYTNILTCSGIGLSGDGNRFAYWSGSGPAVLNVLDRSMGSNFVATTAYPVGSDFRFSRDSRFMTFLLKSTVNGPSQVYVYDFRLGVNNLVSRKYNSSSAVTSNCNSTAISPDGRFIAFRSTSAELDPLATNGIAQIFLFDQNLLQNKVLTTSRFANAAADNGSLVPIFSNDGQTLFLESWAADLAGLDFNHGSDIFAYPFLILTLTPDLAGQGMRLSWPAAGDTPYQVQYKNDPGELSWQILGGSITFNGIRAFFTDPNPLPPRRIYRVVAAP